ncbi:hypothetical protein [Polaromonas sp. UBA4122]|uniref:hypothetical protein n=1 Tax=Polaromonas sp. UBA4122 TaxID=1947074 RepID=UPI0025D4EB08|nr:hypothetical protein [Polaromonas sp. UBA4122]
MHATTSKPNPAAAAVMPPGASAAKAPAQAASQATLPHRAVSLLAAWIAIAWSYA